MRPMLCLIDYISFMKNVTVKNAEQKTKRKLKFDFGTFSHPEKLYEWRNNFSIQFNKLVGKNLHIS